INGEELIEFGIVDEIIPEPQGGAHKDPSRMGLALKEVLTKRLKDLSSLSGEEIIEKRYDRFRRIGEFTEKN
ncbi:MAG: acetyl-CoA carboxylase carboxyl transferase subunit alpha, partial [Candidatus Omnitrophica bacterium]|nr:acetyl-CoA carboxylase carboxyl transferase subunit alpha [Candidatus Omnitrophota bacterium]